MNFINRLKLINDLDNKERKLLEINQGRRIQNKADKIWGWATPAGKFRVERRIDEILKKIGNNLNENKILELGCGTGVFTSEFIKKGMPLISFDISYELLKSAQDKGRVNKILVGDVESIPFGDETFDFIIGISILHHLDIDRALEEIKRVLKKGGKIILSEPNMANPQIFLQKNIRWLKEFVGDTPTETAFFRHKLGAILRKNGFRQIQICPFEFIHPSIPNFLINFIRKLEFVLERTPFIREIAGSLLIFAQKNNV